MPDRFTQNPTWQKATVAKRVRLVHQEQVQGSLYGQVLESVIQNQNVGVELLDGISA